VDTQIFRNWLLPGIAVVGLVLFSGQAVSAQETGESLFKSKCAMCHGADAKGETPMGKALKIPDLHSEAVQKLGEAGLQQVITKGKNKMPAYEDKLSKEQIEKLADFVRELAKKH